MRESCGVGGRCAAARRRREGSHAHDTASATCVMSRGRGGAPRTPSGGMGGTRHKFAVVPPHAAAQLALRRRSGSGHAALPFLTRPSNDKIQAGRAPPPIEMGAF